MNVPAALNQAMQSLGIKSQALSPLVASGGGCWFTSIPGDRALHSWEKLRDRASETGFWPLLVISYPGESGEQPEDLLQQWIGNGAEESSPDETKSPAAIVAAARALPFEKWVEQERDPEFQCAKYLKKAAVYDGIAGAETMAKLYRECAERFRREPKWEPPDPEACRVPPITNHSPPQQELHSTQWLDFDTDEEFIAATVPLLLVPCRYSWEVPACLSYTTREGELTSEVHVAALEWLWNRFSAELVGLDHRVVEVIPSKRPQTKREAVLSADILGAYSSCPVTSENERATLEELAFYLMESRYWTFCWP